MRLGIVCSSFGNLGHASVARDLAERALAHGGVERLVFISDQSEVLSQWSFFPRAAEVLALGRDRVPALDVVIIDSLPFRRAHVLDALLPSLPRPLPRIVLGHIGWGPTLPIASEEQLDEWARLLRLLQTTSVLVYHPEEVCEGRCHVAQLAPRLGISVVHSGLLLPPQLPSVQPHPNTFVLQSGGGKGSQAVVDRARQFLEQLPGWECDLVKGPFSEELSGSLERIRILNGVTDVARRLRAYQFSITRTGYSACCEHIAAQIPTIGMPLDNIEQQGNAIWLSRYVPQISVSSPGTLKIVPPESAPPRAFEWAAVAHLMEA